MSPASGVTVILSGYRRPHTLRQQLEAIKRQTVKPVEILFWRNQAPSPLRFEQDVVEQMVAFEGNANLGVWARFAFALMARTRFVCIFDDDTIPGPRWLENCLSNILRVPGLYGTIGIIFASERGYDNGVTRIGWDNPNEETTKVDIVGHSWFFEREYLSAFWRELPDPRFRVVGEDIHFSFMLQKYLGLGTYVPPHPVSDRTLWGSDPSLAVRFGADDNATGNFGVPLMSEYVQLCVQRGFRIIKGRGQAVAAPRAVAVSEAL